MISDQASVSRLWPGPRPQHYQEILDGNPAIDWFEIITENYLIEGGQPLHMLDRIVERYPVVMHGVSLSIASTAPLDLDYLGALKTLAKRVNPKWISDHLCWTGVHGVNLHDLLPIPYTEEALNHVVDRVGQVQDFLGRRLALENVSTYVTVRPVRDDRMGVLSASVAKRADCWLLFDVNNVYVSAFNHGFSTDEFLHGVPRDRVVQFHVAGHSHEGSHIIDTHDHPVCPGGVGLLSRDGRPFRAGIDHDRARRQHPAAGRAGRRARSCALDRPRSARRRSAGRQAPRCGGMKSLKELQDSFQRGILAGDDAILDEVNDSDKEQRKVLFGVYRHAYVARLAEILDDDYEQLHAYLGDQAFAKLVKAYIAANPSDQRSARWFGRHLPAFVRDSETYAKHPEAAELAQLEKALADAFDGPDAAPLGIEALAAIQPDDWPNLVLEPHPTAIRLTFKTNAADIWSALKDEVAPPKPEHLTEPQAIVVWRQDFMARFRPLAAEEAMMWDEAGNGVRFGVLCELVATFAGEHDAELRAATYLKGWIDTGMLAGCRTA